MKNNMLLSIVISVGFLVNMSAIRLVHADGGATAAAAAAAWAIKKAEEEGLFDCALHLGANQCRAY